MSTLGNRRMRLAPPLNGVLPHPLKSTDTPPRRRTSSNTTEPEPALGLVLRLSPVPMQSLTSLRSP